MGVLWLVAVAVPVSAQLPISTVSIGWEAVTGATGYTLITDGVAKDVGNPPVNPLCVCPSVTVPIIPAMAHAVTVTAYDATRTSAPSAPLTLPATCAPGQPLSGCWNVSTAPPLWQGTDIGFVFPAGRSATGPAGALTLQAGGLAVTGTLDAFYLVSTATTVNGSLSARLLSLGPGAAGLTWQEDTTAQGRRVSVSVGAAGQLQLVSRGGRGGATRLVASAAAGGLPVWVKLVRGPGNLFTATFSPNGTLWSPIGTVVLPMPTAVRVGVFVLSGATSTATTAQFDAVLKTP